MTSSVLCERLKPRSNKEPSQSSSNCSSMHLTRPKSSKGRSRSAPNSYLCTGNTSSIQKSPVSAAYSRPDGDQHSQSQTMMGQTSHPGQDGVLRILQRAPAAPPLSLNKYKVLPSIEGRQPERSLEGQMSHLSLEGQMSHLSLADQNKPEEPEKHLYPKSPDPGPWTSNDPTGSLLLAIRAPCGRRFQQHFDPSDTLLAVKASAEVRYGTKYGDASIKTMDVPRRTFTDMSVTLARCGIFNRSVLCISQSDSEVEHE